MSISDNIDRMTGTFIRRLAQVIALAWLCWEFEWPWIALLAVSHLGTIKRVIDRDIRKTYDGYFGDGNG